MTKVCVEIDTFYILYLNIDFETHQVFQNRS